MVEQHKLFDNIEQLSAYNDKLRKMIVDKIKSDKYVEYKDIYDDCLTSSVQIDICCKRLSELANNHSGVYGTSIIGTIHDLAIKLKNVRFDNATIAALIDAIVETIDVHIKPNFIDFYQSVINDDCQRLFDLDGVAKKIIEIGNDFSWSDDQNFVQCTQQIDNVVNATFLDDVDQLSHIYKVIGAIKMIGNMLIENDKLDDNAKRNYNVVIDEIVGKLRILSEMINDKKWSIEINKIDTPIVVFN